MRSNDFIGLSVKKQRERLLSIISKDETISSMNNKNASSHVFIVATVQFYLAKVQKFGKLDDWIRKSVPFSEFVRLSLEEKQKYHNALIAYHDKCMKTVQSPPDDQFLDSSPSDRGGDCIDFDDTSKWKKV